MSDWKAILGSVGGVGGSPPSGAIIPNVDLPACGTPTIFTSQSAGHPTGTFASLPLSYSAPSPLGPGALDAIFGGVEYFIDTGEQMLSFGEFKYPGVAGGGQSDTLISDPLPWPATSTDWDIYFLSHSTLGYSSTLVKKGNPGATPYAVATVGGPVLAPLVAIFQVGHVDANGNWAQTMVWNILNQELVIDWAAVLPVNLNNFGGMAIWIYDGTQYVQVTAILTLADFQTDDAGAHFHHDQITVTLDKVPATPQVWTFIAVSYDTSTPMVANLDGGGHVTGPSATLSTLSPVNIPNFNPPGPVTRADWSAASDQTPNLIDILAVYTPPIQTDTAGPFEGVDLFLRETGPGIHSGGVGSERVGGQHLGSFPSDGTTNQQTISAQQPAATAAGQTWSITYRPYGPTQSGADSTRGLNANDVQVAHTDGTIVAGVAYELQYSGASQIAAGVTAIVTTAYDEAGSPQFGFEGTFPVPVDPLFAYCEVVAFWDTDPTTEIILAQPSQGSFDTDTWASYPANNTGITIRFYAVNQMGTINKTGAPFVHLSVARPTGVLGQEWAPNIPFTPGTTPTAFVVFDIDDVGAQRWWLAVSWTLPSDLTTYRGLKIFALPSGGILGDRIELYTAHARDTAATTKKLPMPGTAVNYRIHFCSMDGNGRMNSMNTAITPPTPYVDVTVAPSVTGTLDPTRLAAAKLDATLGIVGGKLAIPDFALGILKFGAGVHPIAIFAAAFPALPDSRYPAGSMGISLSTSPPTKKVVSTDGSTWQAAINGTTDIVAGSISTTSLDTVYLSAAVAASTYVSTTFLVANYTTTQTLTANYATINFVTAMQISASRIIGGTIVATISIQSAFINGGVITGTTMVLTLNGIVTSLNNAFTNGVLFGLTVAAASDYVGIGARNVVIFSGFNPNASVGNFALTGNGTSLNAYRAAIALNDIANAHSIIIDPGVNVSSINWPCIQIDGLVVLSKRQTGPGVPSFTVLADAQTWCTNLNNALKGHGLIT